jgi:CHAT domain-containing protein
LYDLLFEPIAAELDGKRQIVIMPDGATWSIPFAALKSPDGQYVLDRWEIAFGYGLHTLLQLQRRGDEVRSMPSTPPHVFANPSFGSAAERRLPGAEAKEQKDWITTLPGTSEEAIAIRAAVPDAVIFDGPKALEDEFYKLPPATRFLHFATHGFANPDIPLLSGVVLGLPPNGSSRDGFLTASEVLASKLTTRLVIVSACESGVGKVARGEGQMGLSWSLLVAGAPTCVVSQWAVSDSATAKMMGEFHRRLAAGERTASALRNAALALKADPRYDAPFFWAPFVLYGDPR